MRRALVILLVLVLAAAAVNVPLALTRLPSRSRPGPPTLVNDLGADAAARKWPAATPHDAPWPAPTQWTMAGTFGHRSYNVFGSTSLASGEMGRFQMEVDRMGWPFPVLERVQCWWPWNDPAWQTTAEPDPPLRLAWSGAILNPILAGGALWVVFVLPVALFFTLRRRIRIAHDCCLGCGHPLRGAERCPECGRPSVDGGDEAVAAPQARPGSRE